MHWLQFSGQRSFTLIRELGKILLLIRKESEILSRRLLMQYSFAESPKYTVLLLSTFNKNNEIIDFICGCNPQSVVFEATSGKLTPDRPIPIYQCHADELEQHTREHRMVFVDSIVECGRVWSGILCTLYCKLNKSLDDQNHSVENKQIVTVFIRNLW